MQDDGQIEAAIETLLPFGKITTGILLEIERMIRSVNRCFEISRNRIFPQETRPVGTLAFFANFLLRVRTPGLGHRSKTSPSIRCHRGRDRQMLRRPRFDLSQTECLYPREHRQEGPGSSVVFTAAMNETLFSDPLPAFPPGSSPLR